MMSIFRISNVLPNSIDTWYQESEFSDCLVIEERIQFDIVYWQKK